MRPKAKLLFRTTCDNQLFAKLDSVNRYAILYRVHDAKKPETRTSRIQKHVQMLARGETIYPLKAKK